MERTVERSVGRSIRRRSVEGEGCGEVHRGEVYRGEDYAKGYSGLQRANGALNDSY
jgi:hypothetical protein